MRLLLVIASYESSRKFTSKWTMTQTVVKNLEGRGIECKMVDHHMYLEKGLVKFLAPSMSKKKRSFERLLDEFEPDAVILDHPSRLGPVVAGRGIPLLVHFWDHWMHRKAAREDGLFFIAISMAVRARRMDSCLKAATTILAETDSISSTIRRHYPGCSVMTFPYSSIDTDGLKKGDGGAMALKHPCVGLLQYADRWSKAREMLVLPRVMEALPHVTFYWAGDGRYRDRVLAALSGHDNFEWLGALEYPDKVMGYLSSIDIYGLASGNDMSPYSVKMAMSMEIPVIATDIGGVSETMRDERTGFIVKRGDYGGWVEKISLLLNDPKMAQDMGRSGRKFVQENWDINAEAEKLVGILEEIRPK